MQDSLCNFLIIKSQTALYHAIQCTITCDAVIPFCRQLWCKFYNLCGLVNIPIHKQC